jgi:tetratricopeptide (TPR) repeat protein
VTAAEAGAAAIILDHVWVGAGIHIHTGGAAGAREPLLPWDEELPADPNAVLALLAWQTRLAPLAGRDTAKLSLLDWARQGRRKRIRLLSGPGGVGKSRLAAEVAEALRKGEWTAGFISPKEPIVVPLRRAGLFLIVDDPEEDPEATQKLLREVEGSELREVPLRLVVVSRQAGDRWFNLFEAAHAGRLVDAQEIGLSGLVAADPDFLFAQSLRRLADHYNRPMPTISSDAVRRWVALNPELHGLPLFLTAAAIHAFLNPDAALGLGGGSVVQALADRERARLDNGGRAAGLGARGASRVVALAAVPGSLDASMLRRLADPVLEIGLLAPDRVIDAVGSLPWWHNDRVPAPEPDIMAASLLVKVLSERSDKAAEWLWAVIEGAAAAPLIDRLGRLAFDAITLTGSAGGLIRHLSEMVRNDPSRAAGLTLFAYEKDLPFGLASFAADICRALLRTTKDRAIRGELLNNWSLRLRETGNGRDALAAMLQAVEIRRRLAEQDPIRIAPSLAQSLNNLSNYLHDAGNGPGALAAIQEAVEIYQWLAPDERAGVAADFAAALHNLSIQLSEIDESAGALVAVRDAVEIYRRLAHDNPERFEPDLAQSLNNLSTNLSEGNDNAGALAAIREAVDIRRRLVQHYPERFVPDLAGNLHNLSTQLGISGDSTGALAAIREALDIRRQLSHDNPARFAGDFARSLKLLELLEQS